MKLPDGKSLRHRKTLLIWNAHAGSSGVNGEVRGRLLEDPQTSVAPAENAEEAAQAAANAIREGFTRIIAAGGDGTVAAVANGMESACRELAADCVLGIIPLGTGNDLCRTLEIPLDPFEAVDLLQTGAPRRIDLVRVTTPRDTRVFTNLANGGNSSEVSRHVTSEMKQRWGPLAYVMESLEILSHLNCYDLRIACDERPAETIRALNVVIANGRTVGGGFEAAPRADIEDGQLEVIIALESTVLDAAAIAAQMLFADYLESEHVIYRRARRVQLEAEPELHLSADGELIEGQPIEFEILPHALEVIVGPEYGDLK